jgi:hypothetical protein
MRGRYGVATLHVVKEGDGGACQAGREHGQDDESAHAGGQEVSGWEEVGVIGPRLPGARVDVQSRRRQSYSM